MSLDVPDPSAEKDYHTKLERALIDEYLRLHGHDAGSLSRLPKEQLELVLKQACTYASGKLAEVEARAHFVHDIHGAEEAGHGGPRRR